MRDCTDERGACLARWARWTHAVGAVSLALAAGCGAADDGVDPGELALRDLLGVSPAVAEAWGAEERAAARGVLEPALALADEQEAAMAPLGLGARSTDPLLEGLAAIDDDRARRGLDPVALGEALVGGGVVELAPRAAGALRLGEVAGDALLAELAAAAGHPAGAGLAVALAPREPLAAVYLAGEGRLLVNPVLIAALEPEQRASALALLPGRSLDPRAARSSAGAAALEGPAAAAPAPRARVARTGDGANGGADRVSAVDSTAGNPYSFFGSVAECAADQRIRCEECLAAADCVRQSRDASSGAEECETLGSGDGAGYFLFCVNLSLAIATVAECVEEEAGSCPVVEDASNQLSALEHNRVFIDDATCGGALDGCLADLYGEPEGDYPAPPQPGDPPPPPPPPARETNISCGDSSCEFSPQCDASCSGGSCDNALSCGGCGDSGCGGGGGGDGGGGCGGGDDGGGGGGGDGGGGCDSGCSGGDGSGGCDSGGCDSGGCDGGCGGGDGGDGGGSGGGGCGGGSDGGDSGGGGCGGGGDGGSGGGCGGGDGGCSAGGCGDCSSGSSGSSCNVSGRQRRMRSGAVAVASVMWALAPLMLFGFLRRRERRRGTGHGGRA